MPLAEVNPAPASGEDEALAPTTDFDVTALEGEARLLRLRTIAGLTLAPLLFAVVLLLPLTSLKPPAHRLASARM